MRTALPYRSLTYRDTGVISARIGLPTQMQAPNEYDACLKADADAWEEIVGNGGLQKYCCPKGRKPYTQRPWISMPAEGRRFKPIAILATASAVFDDTDQVIPFTTNANLYVPIGYDGVITDVMCGIFPGSDGVTGFVEGSGDLIWRLSAAGRYLRDLGNIQTSLGSLTAPNPVPRGGLRIYSDDQLVWTCRFAAGADSRISASARIVCSLVGWYYPR